MGSTVIFEMFEISGEVSKVCHKKTKSNTVRPKCEQVFWAAAARPTFTFLIHSLVYASAINMSTAQQELFAESIQSESSFKILKLKRNNYTEKISKNIYTEKLANAWATNLSTTEQEALAESIQSDTSKLHFDSMMTLPPAQMTKWTNQVVQIPLLKYFFLFWTSGNLGYTYLSTLRPLDTYLSTLRPLVSNMTLYCKHKFFFFKSEFCHQYFRDIISNQKAKYSKMACGRK